jgi:hypothetical protein
MIQEELKNFIEQNCSGKEPSDLIMEAIGQKIEQLGADADEVLAFVEECAKGPTLEEKAEAARRTDENIALLKYFLKRYINIMNLDGCKIRARETTLPWDKYELRPDFFYLYRKLGGCAVVMYQIDDIKAEAVNYSKSDEEINSLLDEAKHKEASTYFSGVLSGDKKSIKDAEEVLSILKNDYGDIATQQIADLEAKIVQARKKRTTKKKADSDENDFESDEEKRIIEKRKKLEKERKKLEEERRKLEEERKKLEEERRKLEEINQKEGNSFLSKFSKLFG